MKKFILAAALVLALTGCSQAGTDLEMAEYKVACLKKGGIATEYTNDEWVKQIICKFTYPNLPSSD